MGRFLRRVVRSARAPRRASRASTVRSADGKQYRVVEVNEAKDNEFADPPRKWGRVGAMVGVWGLLLALGGWVAPAIAASGNPENEDSRDQPASSANNAAWRYLRYGSNQDLDRAEATLCEDASPELTPSDLDAIRQSYDDELGGITRVDLETGDPVAGTDGTTVAGTVSYIHEATQRFEDFVVTVQEEDGAFCVSNAVQVEDDEPSAGDGTGDEADPQAVATEFLRAIVVDREPAAATASQCASYTGATPEEFDAAITEWAADKGDVTAFIDGIDPAESTETSITNFAVEISLKAGLNQENFTFTIGVQEDCIVSLAGGDGLI
ncbi:hypothetical protein [Glycomyces rhizosphaerae]|uniref:Uncharacterized protein n=1 Tax=Glycomyces rhizosphaerae TaxID=2054422 RepID=A0ABV7Q0B2_9ACTN